MDIKLQEKLAYYFMRVWFVFVFIVTFLYIVYEPATNLYGRDYRTAWGFGLAFGFTFGPVVSWLAYPIVSRILKYKEGI